LTIWNTTERGCCFASADDHPTSASAVGFRKLTCPFSSVTMTASPMLDSAALRTSFCSGAAAGRPV
jgi:hypothetical protein